jgi:general secretion pathway protein G
MDPWDRPYQFGMINGSMRVWTYGADGKPGGDGEDADFGRCGLVGMCACP